MSPSNNLSTKEKDILGYRSYFYALIIARVRKWLKGLLRKIAGDQVEVFSAGSEPTSIHPLAIKVMSEIGIDLTQNRSKHFNEFVGQYFDYIVTVCDRVREVCPVFPCDPEQIHWSFPDPVAIEGNLQTQEKGFVDTANQLTTRIKYLLLMIERNRKEIK